MKQLIDALAVVKAKKAELDAATEAVRKASDAHQTAIAEATALHEAFTASVADVLPSVSRVRTA